jgi:ribosomal protein L32
MTHVRRAPVESNAFASVGYDAARRVLALEFKSGGVHHLVDVSPEDADKFLASDSKGSYFHKHLKGRFASEKVDAPPLAECPKCGDKGLAGTTCEDCGTSEYGALR